MSAKLLKRAMKHRTGKRRPTLKQARDWYQKLPGRSVFDGGMNAERNELREARKNSISRGEGHG